MKLLGQSILLFALMPTVLSQGLILFSNFSRSDDLDARAVYAGTSTGVSSPPFYAQLLQVAGSSELPVGAPVAFRSHPLAAGYTVPAEIKVQGAAIGSAASFRMVVLYGNSYSHSAIVGRSSVVKITLGPDTQPPFPLIALTDISGGPMIQVFVPEPAATFILIFGVLSLIVARSKPGVSTARMLEQNL